MNFYKPDDHANILSLLESLNDSYWVVSYDNAAEIKNYYSKFRTEEYDLHYHAGKATMGREIIIYGNHLSKIKPVISY